MTRPLGSAPAALLSALVLVALVLLSGPAEAHRLKLFLATDGDAISGYAFFVGGGRPQGVAVVVADANGREVHRTVTDDLGNFRWRPDVAADYTVTVDSGDGHRIAGTLSADRLRSVLPAAGGASAPLPVAPPSVLATAPAAPSIAASPTALDPERLSQMVERAVDVALARQLRPLMEAYDQAEGRVRFNDVMGGVGMIVGLAGAALWAAGRRRERGGTR